MIRIILFLSISVNIIYANRLYYIQFGSFRQLPVLERSINRMPYNLRSHVIVVRSNGWFIPFAYHTAKLYALKSKLSLYRRYFPDAHIASSPYILNHKVIRNYTSKVKKYNVSRDRQYKYNRQEIPKYQNIITNRDRTSSYMPYSTTTTPYAIAETIPIENTDAESYITITKTVIPKPTKELYSKDKKYKNFNKRMLSGRHYYLAYKSVKKDTPDLLVKVSFKNYKVTYQPMMGNMSMREARYLVDNNKLYMFADNFSKDGAFSKIEGNRKDYILVSSWFNGKKINTLRYYYDLNKAKNYLGEKSLGKLATALEDGDFDRLHQAFIGVDGVYTVDNDDW